MADFDALEYLSFVERGVGYCVYCAEPTEAVTGPVENHTANAECPTCHGYTVTGLPRALHKGWITVIEWDPRGREE